MNDIFYNSFLNELEKISGEKWLGARKPHGRSKTSILRREAEETKLQQAAAKLRRRGSPGFGSLGGVAHPEIVKRPPSVMSDKELKKAIRDLKEAKEDPTSPLKEASVKRVVQGTMLAALSAVPGSTSKAPKTTAPAATVRSAPRSKEYESLLEKLKQHGIGEISAAERAEAMRRTRKEMAEWEKNPKKFEQEERKRREQRRIKNLPQRGPVYKRPPYKRGWHLAF